MELLCVKVSIGDKVEKLFLYFKMIIWGLSDAYTYENRLQEYLA